MLVGIFSYYYLLWKYGKKDVTYDEEKERIKREKHVVDIQDIIDELNDNDF